MKEIKTVCVAGAGSMGRQIALNAALHGYRARVKTSKAEKNAEWCKSFMNKGLAKGKYTEKQVTETLGRMVYADNTEEAVKGADLIIESVIEDESVKRTFFEEVNRYASKDAIVTTNSSYIASSKFIDLIDNPGRLANLHYFNPAMYMTLVEIVRGTHTADETVETLKAFVDGISKQYIIVNKEIEGFVVNRLLRAIQNEGFFLYKEGVASFEDIDTGAEKGLNHPMGPFRLVDLTGIDICYMNRKAKFDRTGDPADEPPAFLKEKYEKGELGRKTGKGWYDYSEK
ncbi:MAG: 3-hydroxyacyl-CoA dehydrogenase family protein [Clostridiales Family XIII bacterium]|jgi:3-hydroxybutyryl-CoA dehydrogenase|nr:3-hydroxyacyl-CoA dehydrogenase family protein [Clostridiales Family XIII bacterium]